MMHIFFQNLSGILQSSEGDLKLSLVHPTMNTYKVKSPCIHKKHMLQLAPLLAVTLGQNKGLVGEWSLEFKIQSSRTQPGIHKLSGTGLIVMNALSN